MSRSHLLLIVLVFVCMGFLPVSAAVCNQVFASDGSCYYDCNPPDIGNLSTSDFRYENWYDGYAGAGANVVVYNITFNHIENIANFQALMTSTGISVVYPDWGAGYTPGAFANDSTIYVSLIHDGEVISTGRLSYSIETVSGANSPVVVSYVADTWNPGDRTGQVAATIQYPVSTGTGSTWRLHTGSLVWGGLSNISTSKTTIYFGLNFGASPIASTIGPNYRWYFYTTGIEGGYERIVGEAENADLIKVDKCFETNAGTIVCRNLRTEVRYYESQHGWINVTDSISNKTTFSPVPKGRNVHLRVTDSLGVFNDWYWMFCSGEDTSIQVSKGSVPTFPAVIGEDITAWATYGGDPSTVGSILWSWTRDGPSSTVPLKNALYVYNTTNLTWENDYAVPSTARGAYTFEQATTLDLDFQLGDDDLNWTSLGDSKNQVWIQLLDIYNNPLAWASKRVYVGSSTPSMFQFDIITEQTAHVNNARLWVKDLTTGFMYTGETLASGVTHNRSVVNHSYVAWATHDNYTFSFGCINSPIQNTCPSYAIGAQTVNFTALYLGEENVILKMSPKTPGLINASFIIRVIDGEIGAALEGASVRIDYGYNRYTYFTDASGEVKLTRLIVGNSYPYFVQSGFYQPAMGNFTAVNGGYLTIKLYETAANLTPTPTLTPGPGEEGYVPTSLIDSLVAIAALVGVGTVIEAKLFVALGICAFLAFLFGIYMGFQAALIGALIGFVGCSALGLIAPWILLVIIFLASTLFISKWWFGGNVGG